MDCFNCDNTLEVVIEKVQPHPQCTAMHAHHVQHSADALYLGLNGGFGEFFDGEPIGVFLCKDCAILLVNLFPKLGEMMILSTSDKADEVALENE